MLKLTGKIVESGYAHPHGHVHLETPGKTWHGARAAFAHGAPRVTVEGYPNREKIEEMRAERISVNGKTVELR